MNIRAIIIAASIGLSAPSLASAQTQPAGAPLSFSVIEQRLAADGFRVVEIERYPNSVEVKGYDRAGLCMEMHLDPRTGNVLRRERDDDCSRGGDDDRGRRGRRS
ncbi:MAG: hypothetical protein A4S17_00800 [Proteobacteria bacterium HN_bin10]|nr:MAG: hypothetical protein A4S17_00800 [Proteobacteria bacterium HN_bin10]